MSSNNKGGFGISSSLEQFPRATDIDATYT